MSTANILTVILVLFAVFTIAGLRSNYGFFRFLAGAMLWVLGYYLVKNPMFSAGDSWNDAVVVICFIGGFGVMMWLNYIRDNNGNERFNFRMPRIFGGETEEQEKERTRQQARGFRQRNADYAEKLNRLTRR